MAHLPIEELVKFINEKPGKNKKAGAKSQTVATERSEQLV
jgi:hypothetical protein